MPPRHRIEQEPLPQRNRVVHIGRSVKEEPTPPPRNRLDRFDRSASSLSRFWCGKERALPSSPRWRPITVKDPSSTLANVCGRLLHYLGHDGVIMSSQEKLWEWHNMQRRAAFTTSDVALDWVCADPSLVDAWALDRSRTTTETSERRRHCLSHHLVKIGVAELLHAAALVRDKGKARGGRARAASAAIDDLQVRRAVVALS